MNEIRRQERIDCDIMLNKKERGLMHICRATNISLGGMRIQRLLEPFTSKDSKLQLELALPGEEDPIIIAAQRVYEEEDHFGVRFVDISHQHFVRLRSWLSGQELGNELPVFH